MARLADALAVLPGVEFGADGLEGELGVGDHRVVGDGRGRHAQASPSLSPSLSPSFSQSFSQSCVPVEAKVTQMGTLFV